MNKDLVNRVRAIAALPFILVGMLCVLVLEFTNFCAIIVGGVHITVEEE